MKPESAILATLKKLKKKKTMRYGTSAVVFLLAGLSYTSYLPIISNLYFFGTLNLCRFVFFL